MTRILLTVACFVLLISARSEKHEFSQWRGPNRDGIYNETNLLKVWPDEGPELLWSFEGLGMGHSSAAVTSDKVYVTGIKDTVSSVGTLFTFDLEGNLLWETEFGPDFTANFRGTRSTPVVVDNLIYIESGMGAVYCLNAETGEQIWSVDFIKDFGVDSVIQFGYSESVLIDGDYLFCVPGGRKNNVVKLNRFTGDLIWTSEGFKEPATYNSSILVQHDDQKLIVAMTMSSIIGMDINTGEMYWRIPQFQDNKIHANTPVFADGKIVVSSASRKDSSGLVQIQLSPDGKNAKVAWRYPKFINLMGGLVKIDNYLYGSAYLKNDWQVIDWNTGEMLLQNKDFGGGSIIYADGLFYCYAEHDSEIALVNAGPDKFDIVSKFKVPLGTAQHWAHPVIDNGRLYVRHGDALMVYNILAES